MPSREAVVANIDRRVEREAETITSVIEWWLTQEALSNSGSHNAYLDDFQQFEHELRDASNGIRNGIASKASAHYSRLITWTNDVIQVGDEFSDKDLDYLFARQLFGVLMLTSGNLRKQALLAATSQEEYSAYRSNSSTVGVNIQEVVRDRVWWHRAVKELQPPNKEEQDLLRNTLTVNELSYQWANNFLYDRGPGESGRKHTETLAAGHVAEQALLELAVDYVFFLDNRNLELKRTSGYDGFAGVPFLEPKSITLGPAVIYPFATS